ncbi:unnamed protein product, partial [Protopolystoma xenopodis]
LHNLLQILKNSIRILAVATDFWDVFIRLSAANPRPDTKSLACDKSAGTHRRPSGYLPLSTESNVVTDLQISEHFSPAASSDGAAPNSESRMDLEPSNSAEIIHHQHSPQDAFAANQFSLRDQLSSCSLVPDPANNVNASYTSSKISSEGIKGVDFFAQLAELLRHPLIRSRCSHQERLLSILSGIIGEYFVYRRHLSSAPRSSSQQAVIQQPQTSSSEQQGESSLVCEILTSYYYSAL